MPRKVNFAEVVAAEPGEFKSLAPGAYPVVITKAREEGGANPRVIFTLDICEGKEANALKDAWDSAKDIVLWDNERNDAQNKFMLDRITADNPGFDACAAWNGQRLDMFVGKRTGCVFREEEWFSGERAQKAENIGVVRTQTKPWKFAPIEQVRMGQVELPKLKKLSAAKAAEAAELRKKHGTGEFALAAMPNGGAAPTVAAVPDDCPF